LAAGADVDDMPFDADGKLHNPDESIFTGAADAKRVSLINMIPPISKMDPKQLGELKACQHLGLSTNCISAIASLNGLRHLKTLSLSRNNIKKIEKLDPLADTLEQLWLSYNQVIMPKGTPAYA